MSGGPKTLLALVVLAFALASCGSSDPTAGRVHDSNCATVTLTAAFGGKTLHVRVCERVNLSLQRSSMSWTRPMFFGTKVLAAIGALSFTPAKVLGGYRVDKKGTETIRAVERPVCIATKACPQYELLWQVVIVAS